MKIALVFSIILLAGCSTSGSDGRTGQQPIAPKAVIEAAMRTTASDTTRVGMHCSFTEQATGNGRLLTFGDDTVVTIRSTADFSVLGTLRHGDIVTQAIQVNKGYLTSSGMSTITLWDAESGGKIAQKEVSLAKASVAITKLLTDATGSSVVVETLTDLLWYPDAKLDETARIHISQPGEDSDVDIDRTHYSSFRKAFLIDMRSTAEVGVLPLGKGQMSFAATGEKYLAIQEVAVNTFLMVTQEGDVLKCTDGKAVLLGQLPTDNAILGARCWSGSQWWIALRKKLYVIDPAVNKVYHVWDSPTGDINGLAFNKSDMDGTMICGYGYPQGFLCKVKFRSQ